MKAATPLAVSICALALAAAPAPAATLPVTDGLVVWLKADTITGMADGETFSAGGTDTWADSSGPGVGDGIAQDAVLSDGGPTYRTNQINGLPIVGFGGGGALKYDGAVGISGAADLTAFLVGTRTGGGTQRACQVGDVSTTAPNGGYRSVAFDVSSAGFRFNNGNRLFDDAKFDAQYRIGVWRMDDPHTYGTAEYWRGGVPGTQSTVTNPANVTNVSDEGYVVGRGANGGSANDWYTGDLAEVLVYNKALSDAEIAQVGRYLQRKYRLAGTYLPLPDVQHDSLTDILTTLPPPDITEGKLESDTHAFLFAEKVSFVLPSDVDVNLNTPGTHTDGFGSVDATIPAGTRVDSFYLSYDPEGDPGSAIVGDFELTFDYPVLGILTGNTQLNATDALLGAAGTTYLNGNVGLENNSPDFITLSPDRRTLTIAMNVSGGNLDQIRVLTQVPEPCTLLLAALALAPAALYTRRRRARR